MNEAIKLTSFSHGAGLDANYHQSLDYNISLAQNGRHPSFSG
jgi:hypothetical protein